MTAITRISFHEVTRPLRIRFSTAQGKKDEIKSVIVTVTLADGSSGLGECPTSLSFSKETIPVIKKILDEIRPKLQSNPIDDYEPAIGQLRNRYPQYPMTISGLEMALFRAFLANKGIPEHLWWGGRTKTVKTDITLPFVTEKAFLMRWMNYAFRKGFTAYKLKVSGDVGQDKELISFVHSVLSDNLDDFTLRLDGNQGYNMRTFQHITAYIQREGFSIELFEQPLPKDDYQGLKAIKKIAPFPIILDETVITGRDAERVAHEDLAHGINIKIAKSGIAESVVILDIAKKHGLRLMIGCMTETMVGLSAAISIALGAAAFDYIDLDAIFFLHHKNHYNHIALQGPHFVI